jgi:hypothetical protein
VHHVIRRQVELSPVISKGMHSDSLTQEVVLVT